MAKKKETALTPEERLQAALVPDWEQPYKVPKNWCWTKIGAVSTVVSKGTTPKGGKDAYTEQGVGFLRIENIDDCGNIVRDNLKYIPEEVHLGYLKRSILYSGDLLVSIAGTLGKTAIVTDVDLPLNTNQALAFIRLPNEFKSSARFLKYAIDSPIIQDILLRQTKVTSIPNLTLEIISQCPIPFPPVAEQQRVVDCIESLFAQLDEAKEKAQAVVDSFETRKAAILSSAFRGEYTKKWRTQHGVPDTDWKTIRFDQAADIKSNLVDPAEYGDYPHIAPDNIEKKTGVLLDYNTISEDKVTSGKHRFYPGQILYSKIRPYLSKVVVVDFNGLCSADMYPIKAKENTRFLWYYMLSDEFLLQASSSGSRSVLPKINQKELSALSVRMTSRDEQEEVVRILDDIFPKEQQAKEAAEAVLSQIDAIKKSILARAFRGELGTNDPTEESAEELVKRVLLDKIPEDRPKRKRIKKHPEVEFVAKTIMQTLAAGAKITPEKLKAETGLQIDDFYDQLKALIDSGHVVETRIDGESYLEAKDENRQPNN